MKILRKKLKQTDKKSMQWVDAFGGVIDILRMAVGFSFLLYWGSPAWADDSYSVPAGGDLNITEFNKCRSIHNGFSKALFVPTKTTGEWDSFTSHLPGTVTTGACGPAPTPRVISTSHYSDWSGTTYKSPASMSRSNWEISTTGVANGELLLLIANIDNGSDTLWPNPMATGFTQIFQKFHGNDGQTLSVSWKIANSEPASYSGTYVNPSVSYSSVITLIAVSGANLKSPINAYNIDYFVGGNKSSPITATSTGVTTTDANCTVIFLSSIDWQEHIGTSTFGAPVGFTTLLQQGDRGASVWDWTSLQVYYKKLSASGATGSISSTETAAGRTGVDLRGSIAVCP